MPMRATGARPHRTCPHGSRERWTSSAWRNSAHLPYAAGLRPTSRQRQHSLPHPTALSRAQLDSPLRPTREFPYDTRPPSQAGAPTRRASPPCTCGPHLPSLGPREGQSPRPQILPGVNAYGSGMGPSSGQRTAFTTTASRSTSTQGCCPKPPSSSTPVSTTRRAISRVPEGWPKAPSESVNFFPRAKAVAGTIWRTTPFRMCSSGTSRSSGNFRASSN